MIQAWRRIKFEIFKDCFKCIKREGSVEDHTFKVFRKVFDRLEKMFFNRRGADISHDLLRDTRRDFVVKGNKRRRQVKMSILKPLYEFPNVRDGSMRRERD